MVASDCFEAPSPNLVFSWEGGSEGQAGSGGRDETVGSSLIELWDKQRATL